MSENTSRRGNKMHSENPFVKNAVANAKTGVKRISNKAGDRFMIVSDAGEPIAPAGFHQTVEVDRTEFVKLYVNGVRAFQGLKNAGCKVFEIIYRTVQQSPGTDRIHIHFMEVEQAITPISRATFDRGMNELLEKGFVAESMVPGMYYLNIDYLFNGNRLAFIKEYVVAAREVNPDIAGKDEEKQLDWLSPA